MDRQRRCGLLSGSDRLHSSIRLVVANTSCGLLSGSDRLHSLIVSWSIASVADCSQARIGYTRNLPKGKGALVADCSQARIGYTSPRFTLASNTLRTALRLGSVTLERMTKFFATRLRTALRLGSVTLRAKLPERGIGCGLLSGSDRLHYYGLTDVAENGCGLLSGSDRLHSSIKRNCSSCSCGLLSGSDRLHSSVIVLDRQSVADCSQARIGYTSREIAAAR